MNQALPLIEKLKDVTKRGKAIWSKTDYDIYVASTTAGNVVARIEFKSISLTDEGFPETLFATLSVGRIQLTFSTGTQEMGALQEILSYQLSEWAEHRDSIAKILDEAIKQLNEL